MRCLLLIGTLALVGCLPAKKSEPAGKKTGEVVSKKTEGESILDEEIVDAKWLDIQADWRMNLIAAEKKWLGKLVRTSFRLGSMGKQADGKFYIGGWGNQVFASVKSSEEERFAELRNGDIVFIVARMDHAKRNYEFNEPFYDIHFSDAKLEDAKRP